MVLLRTTTMPVELVTLDEISQRQRMLVRKAGQTLDAGERTRILSEIELLRRLADLKRAIGRNTSEPQAMRQRPPHRVQGG
jgi:hypothetical protein